MNLVVSVSEFSTEPLPLLLLNVLLAIGTFFILKYFVHDACACITIIVKNSIVHNQIDSFLRQLVQLLPVAACIE
jgi:hypothetical protein